MKFLRKENIMCFRTKVSFLLLALFVGAGVFSMSVAPAQAATVEELQQIIEDLNAQIAELKAQLEDAQQDATEPAEWCYTFRKNLRYGDRGAGVIALQTALEKEELYEAGKDASGKFGLFTSSAVVAFQEEYATDILAGYGLKHGTGFVGKTTRAKLNKLYGCVLGAPEPPEPSELPEPPESPVTRSCTDSDGGMDKDVKGTACRDLYFTNPNLLDSDSLDLPAKKSFTKQFCRTDRCIARNITPKSYNMGEDMSKGLKTRDAVKEYYCRNGKIFSKIIYCENGCFDGACKGNGDEPAPTCAVEGESVPVVPGALDCCEGLSKISCAKPDSEGVCPEGPCVGASICANCGDDICGLGENKCNCPEDCEESNTEECSTDAECEAIGGCTQVVGGDTAKCDLTTNTCYCGGVCGDGYCDFVEERDGTCADDCDTTE